MPKLSMTGSKPAGYLFVGFNLTFSLVAEHLLHEIELRYQTQDLWIVNEVGVRGMPLHLVLVDGLHRSFLQRVEQQLQHREESWGGR